MLAISSIDILIALPCSSCELVLIFWIGRGNAPKKRCIGHNISGPALQLFEYSENFSHSRSGILLLNSALICVNVAQSGA